MTRADVFVGYQDAEDVDEKRVDEVDMSVGNQVCHRTIALLLSTTTSEWPSMMHWLATAPLSVHCVLYGISKRVIPMFAESISLR
jgi:hypothetical protein